MTDICTCKFMSNYPSLSNNKPLCIGTSTLLSVASELQLQLSSASDVPHDEDVEDDEHPLSISSNFRFSIVTPQLISWISKILYA